MITTEQTVKEHPILFSTDMVRAILAGTKTQTRRVVKGGAAVKAGSRCPYGEVGDLLWVREMLYQEGELGLKYVAGNEWIDNDTIPENHNAYRNYAHCNIPSIHMPKWAARIWLQIEDFRIERLQDISEAGARAEGIEELGLYSFPIYRDYLNTGIDGYQYEPNSFRSLWTLINGRHSWDANPWVWVLTFNVISISGKPDLSKPPAA